MKIIITESQYNKAIDFYITFLLEPHEIKTSERYPGSIFWVKNGEIIVEFENSKSFRLDYGIWMSISKTFDLDYYETKSVINEWLKEHYFLNNIFISYQALWRGTMI